MGTFIPSFHYVNPQEKLTKEWALQAIQYYYHNTDNKSLLHGKNIAEIEEFASGKINMNRFKKLFKSIRAKLDRKDLPENLADMYSGSGGVAEYDFEPLSLISEKINAATAVVSKIPVEVTCEAIDPYASEKRQEDINFLKNKPYVETELLPLADKLGIDDVDLGTTENSSIAFSESPFGLDLENPDELEIFQNLIYSLKVESAFETALQAMYELKRAENIRKLEIKDQLKYGVSCHRAFQSPITGLPDIEYIHPSEIRVPHSLYDDFRDVSHIIRDMRVTPNELFNYFGGEIKDKEHLYDIVNNKQSGYCFCNNGRTAIDKASFDTYKMNLIYIEVRSVDYIGVAKTKHKKSYTTLTLDDSKIERKIWAQNTYGFYWLENTEHIFGLHRLGSAHRELGRESYQNFSINIYKSNEQGAVELATGENKKALIADIKMQFAILKALPAGRYIDLRFLRNAIEGISDGGETDRNALQSILNLALEDNIVIGDTEGFDGKNDGQFKPVIDLSGGVKADVVGYMEIIANANRNISRITGINEQLVGTSANPEGLVGLQKLLINSSINALYYVNEALESQYQRMFSLWANVIKQAVEQGGKAKEAIKSMIGRRKEKIIDGLDDVALHDMAVFVKIGQREEERAAALEEMINLRNQGLLTATDTYMFRTIRNPKDKYAFLATKEQQRKKELELQRQEAFAQQQAAIQQAGENQIAVQREKIQGEAALIDIKSQRQADLLKLAAELGLNAEQLKFVSEVRKIRERSKSQMDKNIEVLKEKSNIEQQEPIV